MVKRTEAKSGRQCRKSDLGRVGALRRPDAAARRPYPGKAQRLDCILKPRRPDRASIALVLALWLLTAFSALAQPKFSASLDRNVVSLGESATLSLTVEGGTLQNGANPPPVAGLQYGGTGTQGMMDLIQGTRKTVITVQVQPLREGTFTIPAILAVVDGRRLTSQPITLRATKGNLPAAADKLEPVFMRLAVPTNTIYAGEVFPLEIKCYCQDAQIQQAPQLNSDVFTLGNPTQFAQAGQVNVRNTIYNFLSQRMAATPTKTGNLTLGPATWQLTLVSQRNMFNQVLRGTQANPVSDTLSFHVLPLPTNDVPPTFTGAVGQFSLAQFEAAPTTVTVGDPITLKVRITGRGSFDAVTLPADLPGWHDFKTYPASKKFDSADPLQIEGSKYFEQVVTAENVGVKELPAFAFSYFDPESGAYRTLVHPAIALNILPSAATPQPTISAPAPSPTDAPPPAQEIVNIKVHLGALAQTGPPLLWKRDFLAWQLVWPLAWVAALLWRRQKENLANNPRLRRHRAVAQLVRAGLGELAAQAKANDAEAFYGTVVRLLQEQLGERLDRAASAITEAVLDEAQGQGLSEPGAALLHELFHACNQFRYTPDHTVEQLTLLIPKVETALRELQKMPVPTKSLARNNLVQGVGCLLFLLASASVVRAGSASDDFDQANKLYEEGKYAPAAAAYEKMTASGTVSAAIYFNLGNAWFKDGQLGHAICAYREAAQLAPRDPDVRANLQFARNQPGLNAPALRGNGWTRAVTRLTLDEWTVLTAVFVALFFIVLTARQIRPVWKKSTGGLVWGLAAGCVFWTVCLGLAADVRFGAQSLVVTVPEAVVRRSPLEEAPTVFSAHDGTELLVVDRKDGWLEVADAANHSGWIPETSGAFAP